MPMLNPRDPGRVKSPLALMLLGIPMVALGVGILPTALPSALADERDYLASPSCPEEVTGPSEAGECRDRRDATVGGTEETGRGDNKDHFVNVDLEGRRYRVELASGQSDIDEFAEGDQVTVVSWRHRIRVLITDDGDVVHARGYPVGSYKGPLMGTVSLLALGFSFLWMARSEWRLKRRGRSIDSVGRWTRSVPSLTALVFGVIALIPVAAPPDLASSLIALGCTTAATVLVGALLWRRQRRKAERRSARLLAETWVSPPTSETVVPARVMGEVPYSRVGDNYLVVGPSGLAAASDPRGVAGRSLPFPPLAFVRLHPVAKRDQRVGPIQNALFVECRDGEHEVLIAARREHLPWILSRLWFQPQS